jgi:hypothetical protein
MCAATRHPCIEGGLEEHWHHQAIDEAPWEQMSNDRACAQQVINKQV